MFPQAGDAVQRGSISQLQPGEAIGIRAGFLTAQHLSSGWASPGTPFPLTHHKKQPAFPKSSLVHHNPITSVLLENEGLKICSQATKGCSWCCLWGPLWTWVNHFTPTWTYTATQLLPTPQDVSYSDIQITPDFPTWPWLWVVNS